MGGAEGTHAGCDDELIHNRLTEAQRDIPHKWRFQEGPAKEIKFGSPLGLKVGIELYIRIGVERPSSCMCQGNMLQLPLNQ